MMVPILAGVTLATNVGQVTSDDVTVSFTYFLLNLVTFQIIQLLHFCNYNFCITIMMSADRGRQKGETELFDPEGVLLLFLCGSRGKG